MARGEIERLFERFRERGDLAALARVFDAAAPQLLSVARHLASDEASAEDLVQATFVAAIEHAQRFAPDRELVPWLTGILTNKAKLARVLAAREPDPERLSEREERDPALDAELREFVATLDRALERVPSKYREVLRKHLADGAKPEQIARELEREPGTVRVQLHRGLAMLRRVLPPGFALGAAVYLASPRGLAAVRTSVLSHARASLATSGSIVLGGWIVSTKSSVVVGVAVLALLGLWWFGRQEAVQPSSAVLAHADVQLPQEAASSPAVTAPDRAEVTAPPTAVAPGAEIRPAPASDRGALDIEIVWHDGTPAAGIKLEVTPLGERQPSQHRRFLVTDEFGHASADELMQGPVEIRDNHRHPEEVASTARVVAGSREHTRIVLARGFDLSGRVVDSRRSPVADAIVWYFGWDAQGHAREIAHTAADGTFSIRSLSDEAHIFATADGHGTSPALPFGTEMMKAPLLDGSQPVLSGLVDLKAQSIVEIELVLDDSRCVIHGVIHGPDGAPVPGARVEWISNNTRNAAGTGVLRQAALPQVTDSNGEFRFAGLLAMWGRVVASTDGFAVWTSKYTKLTESAVNEFNVVLERGLTVSGCVRDGTGTPLAGVRIAEAQARDGRFVDPDFDDHWTSSAADGVFRLEAIASGAFTLEAVVKIDGFEQRVHADMQGREGQALEWNPRFATGPSILGRAIDPQSKPLVGWGIYARRNSDRPSSGGAPTTKTDANGRFEVRALADETYTVRLHPPGDAWSWVAEVTNVTPGGNAIELIGDPQDFKTAYLHGRVVDASGSPVRRPIFASQPRCSGSPIPTQNADGTFRIGPLQRGVVTLSVEITLGHTLDRLITDLAVNEDRDVGDIVIP